jgi:hypothetical protein
VLIRWRSVRLVTRIVRHRSPKLLPPTVCLRPFGGRRLVTHYIRGVVFRRRVAADRYGVPHLKSSGSGSPLTEANPLEWHDLTIIVAGNAARRSDPVTISRDSALEAARVATVNSTAAHRAERGVP